MEITVGRLMILSLSLFIPTFLLFGFVIRKPIMPVVIVVLFTLVSYILIKCNKSFLITIPLFIVLAIFHLPFPAAIYHLYHDFKDIKQIFNGGTQTIIFAITWIITAMYPVTYIFSLIFSLIITVKAKEFSLLSFLPIVHSALIAILMVVIHEVLHE